MTAVGGLMEPCVVLVVENADCQTIDIKATSNIKRYSNELSPISFDLSFWATTGRVSL